MTKLTEYSPNYINDFNIRHLIVGREFEAAEYGACRLEDLIGNVPRYCVAFGPEDGRISLPRHRQTPDEVARMRHFAAQVYIVFLRH